MTGAISSLLWFVYLMNILHRTAGEPIALRLASTCIIVSWSGWALWQLRRRQRVGYGLAEVLFGVAAALWIATTRSQDLMTTTLTAGAAIYVIVRGLDNIETGLKQEQYTPLQEQLCKEWSKRRWNRNSP